LPRDDPDDYAIKVSQWETLTFDHINLAGDTPQVYRFLRPEEAQLVEAPDDVEAAKFSRRPTYPVIAETLPRRGSLLVDNDLWEDDDVAHGMAREGYYMTPNEGGVYDVCGGPGQKKEEDGAPCLLRSSSFDASLLASHNADLETHAIKEHLKGYVRQQSNGY
jgi:hypothetical protein